MGGTAHFHCLAFHKYLSLIPPYISSTVTAVKRRMLLCVRGERRRSFRHFYDRANIINAEKARDAIIIALLSLSSAPTFMMIRRISLFFLPLPPNGNRTSCQRSLYLFYRLPKQPLHDDKSERGAQIAAMPIAGLPRPPAPTPAQTPAQTSLLLPSKPS